MKIVGFVGPKGSGKDTSADLLKELGIAKGKLSFAGPLKEMCSEVFGLPMNFFRDPVFKEKPLAEMEKYRDIKLDSRILKKVKLACTRYLPEYLSDGTMIYNIDRASLGPVENRVVKTPRELLQIVGTEFIRNRIKGDWHLLAAFSDARLSKLDENGVYCVTDIRFENELEFLKSKFGDDFECYYVERPEAEKNLAKAEHSSETTATKIRTLLGEKNVIKNDGTIAALKKKVKALGIKKPTKSETSKSNVPKGSRFVYGPRK